MNKCKTFVGIDVSKKTFDAAILQAENPQQIHHHVFAQQPQGYASFYTWLQEHASVQDIVICMEHTGIYINGLVDYLMQLMLPLWVEMPLRIKKCMGLQRGGDDKLAAMQIAKYAYRYYDQVRLWKPSKVSLEELRQYISQRDRLVLALNQLTVPLQELDEVGQQKQSSQLLKLQAPACRAIAKSIEKVEAAIDKLIASNIEVKEVIQRVSSIKGIGWANGYQPVRVHQSIYRI